MRDLATHSPLDSLLSDGIIDEVLGRLKSGKEADIYLVRHAGQDVAAKVYKDAAQRSFKNNADYKEGRSVRNSRTRRAIDSRSRFGRNAEEAAWKTAEVNALQLLHHGGVRVPRPILFYEGVLLMQLVTDADGRAAPRLIDVAYDPAAARALYLELRTQIVRILCCEVIHGDLSPYNVLAAVDGPTIIDVPQIVSAAHSSRSEFFFLRDFQNVHQFLAGSDRGLLAHRDDGRRIWQAYVRRELAPDWVPQASPERHRVAEPAVQRGPDPHPPRGRRHAPHPAAPVQPPRAASASPAPPPAASASPAPPPAHAAPAHPSLGPRRPAPPSTVSAVAAAASRRPRRKRRRRR
jgi:RIO kinase 1